MEGGREELELDLTFLSFFLSFSFSFSFFVTQVGASFGSLLLITATRSFKKIADPLTRFGQDGFVGLMGALIGSSQLGWPVGAFWGGETIYKG